MRIFHKLLHEALRDEASELLQNSQSIPGFSHRKLGSVDGYPILLLTPNEHKTRPNILIASGFHGDEQAGPYGLLHFMRHHRVNANVSFLPLVNPTGMNKKQRNNSKNENPNRGFDGTQELSEEGKILLKHDKLLRKLASDGFLSLHEDPDKTTFYLYTYERRKSPGDFSETLRACGSKWLNDTSMGVLKNQESSSTKVLETGLVFNEKDSSYESYLFQNGVPYAACTETPGQIDFDKRVLINSDLVKTFIEFVATRS